LHQQKLISFGLREQLIPTSSTSILPENITDEFVFVTPCKITNGKHHVPSPLRNAFYKKTPRKSGVVLPLETKNQFPKQHHNHDFVCLEGSFKFSFELC